jgi:hypothetical protein
MPNGVVLALTLTALPFMAFGAAFIVFFRRVTKDPDLVRRIWHKKASDDAIVMYGYGGLAVASLLTIGFTVSLFK